MTPQRFRDLLARRELNRSRSVAASLGLIVLALVAASIGTECVLALAGLPPLLLSPADAVDGWIAAGVTSGLAVDGDDFATLALLVAAGALAVLGLIALIAALVPARRPRHRLRDARTVLLVDDDVLASAVSRHVARTSGVAAEQVRTAVGRRVLATRVRPTSGHPLVAAELEADSADYVRGLDLAPAARARVAVAASGVIAR
ncbi:hypothetical protein [Schumannella sp. 10F1B-5-1]|uniref:hypothetical protein n=1 Tax=Schumannella sp. 10F1B-5-1 TaxID=2590780 RepID=UPI001131AA18|nr:hypothetical protein [Schumannella sp. 10F1B-5-1]TPW71680.1 hypothetical protein FJ658_10050 [Schumannella sp. 10F1B-5-1]